MTGIVEQLDALPVGWRRPRLKDVTEINPRRPADLAHSDDAPTSFVPMEAVDEVTGTIARPQVRPYGEIKKGYTYFAEGDVLFAKITPCMQNGKHAIARNLLGGVGFGTTEFHVLRPGAEVLAKWVQCFLRQPSVLLEATNHFTGAVGQQRVPPEYLASLTIPLPPLLEQERIMAILESKIETMQRMRLAEETRCNTAKALPAAVLRAVFAETTGRSWRKERLGVILCQRKEIVHPRDKPAGSASFVGLEHIESGTGRRIGADTVEMAHLTGRKPRFRRGDIVYGYLRPYLNKVWIAECDGLCSVDQYVYTVDEALAIPEYVAWFMRSPSYMENSVVGKTPGWLPRIRVDEVASVPICLPPLKVQRQVADTITLKIAACQQLRSAIELQTECMNSYPAAVSRRAFAGALEN